MIQIRRASDRGHADHGWLKTYHTFSFASYRDPNHMGFGALRVMNEDRVAPGRGFGTHAHNDMEIVSYVLDGALEHKDSMGNGEILRPGEFQRITAGTGITHSEFNPSPDEATHFYQIWLLPERVGLEPSYEQKRFDIADEPNRLHLVASRDGEAGSLTIHQDARIYLGRIEPGAVSRLELASGRQSWVQVLRGAASLNGQQMAAGDGAAVTEEMTLALVGGGEKGTELLVFDLA